jgi:spermidine synthase
MEVDLVEIDPLVYQAAVDHFDLALPPTSTVNILDGATYVHSLADLQRSGEYDGQKWRLVVQDCFSGGMVPSALFTREFWQDLSGLVEDDGIVAMVSPRRTNGVTQAKVMHITSDLAAELRRIEEEQGVKSRAGHAVLGVHTVSRIWGRTGDE